MKRRTVICLLGALLCMMQMSCVDDSYRGTVDVEEYSDTGMPHEVMITIGESEDIVAPIAEATKGTGVIGGVSGFAGKDFYVYAFNKDDETDFSIPAAQDSIRCLVDGSLDSLSSVQGRRASYNPKTEYVEWTANDMPIYYPMGENEGHVFDFFAYYLDDMEVTNEQFHRNESNVTIDIEIDGSQDIMSSKAALTEKQKQAILEKADFWETQTMIACSYSYYTAARGINPNFVFKHHLVKLDFKLVPGSIAGASKDIKVDKIEVRSEYKASFNVADKYDDGNVGLTFDADTTTLALTETDGSAFYGRLVTTFKDGQTIDGVIDDMGSLLVAPRDEYDLIITLSEVDEDGNHQTSEPYSNIKVLSVGTAKDPQPFVAGSEYLVTLTVYGKMDVRVSTTIKEWEDGGFYIPPTEDVPE